MDCSRILAVAAALFLFGTGAPASAATYKLDATSLLAGHSNFWVIYNDNGDGILTHGEHTSFSGIQTGAVFRDQLIVQPNLVLPFGLSLAHNQFLLFTVPSTVWLWQGPADFIASYYVDKDYFAYSISELAAVPIPPAIALFATVLAGLGLLGWRRRRQVA